MKFVPLIIVGSLASALPLASLAEDGETKSEPFDLETTRGRSFRDCEVLKVDPDGLTVSHRAGIAKIAFTELGEDVQKRFEFDAEKADKFIKSHTEAEVKKALPKEAARPMPPISGTLYNLSSYQGGWGWGGGVAGWGSPYLDYGGYGVAYGGGYGFAPGYGNVGHGYRGHAAGTGNISFALGYQPPPTGHHPAWPAVGLNYPYYWNWPNVTYQIGPDRRFGNPVAPPLRSGGFSEELRQAVHARAGQPMPRVPVINPMINTARFPTVPRFSTNKIFGGRPGGTGMIRPVAGGAARAR